MPVIYGGVGQDWRGCGRGDTTVGWVGVALVAIVSDGCPLCRVFNTEMLVQAAGTVCCVTIWAGYSGVICFRWGRQEARLGSAAGGWDGSEWWR